MDPDGTLLQELSCFDRFCCEKPECEMVCPKNTFWRDDMRELGGLRFEGLHRLDQADVTLPTYVPVIDHHYRLREVIEWPVVALKLSSIFRLKGTRYEPVAEDAASLRTYFKLSPSTRIVIRGIDDDPPLERYWQNRVSAHACEWMSRMSVDLVIGPNFSHPADAVRTETHANRMRQLICLAEMSAAGLTTVPHLNAVDSTDWRFWEKYLREQPGIRVVAKEFQTGDKDTEEGRLVIDRIAAIQVAVGRPLHLIAVGAAQFAGYVAARFPKFTILDSTPFMKTVAGHREFVVENGEPRWKERFFDPEDAIDSLFSHNLASYSAWLQNAAHLGRGNRIALVRRQRKRQ
ncbi:MAG: hypothetical protein ACRCZF_24530 [Gemmataceae bacterium]